MENQHRKKRQRTVGPSFILHTPVKKSKTDVSIDLLAQILKELQEQRKILHVLQQNQTQLKDQIKTISEGIGLGAVPQDIPMQYNYYA